MASLIDIGKSAINAQRQALNVTGQNIANVNTDGYHRRDASMLEVSGAQSALASISGQLGLGVNIGEVRRAFDAYLVSSANSAESKFQTSSSFVASMERLEDFILPTDGDLSEQLTNFFSKLSDISANPGDLAPRAAAIEQAHGLANSFNTTSQLLGDLKSQLRSSVDDDVDAVNRLLESIGQVNGRLRASNIGAAPPNALLDERDRLVSEVSGLIRVSVNYGQRSEADLRLGRYSEGPRLVNGEDVTPLRTIHSDVSGTIFQLGSGMVFKNLDDGSLKGLANSLEIVQTTEKQLDLLAIRFVKEVNIIHTSGIDFDGEPGKELFTAKKFKIDQPKENSAELDIKLMEVPGKIDSVSELKFTFDSRVGSWSGTDSTGKVVGQGRSEIKLNGMVIQINSKVAHGDTFQVARMDGEAERISFLLKDGAEFAAGANFVITPGSTNGGSANLTSQPITTNEPDLPRLVDVTNNSISPVSYTEFRSGGVVGFIPANVEKLDLSSFGQASALTLNFVSTDTLKSFNVIIGGTTHRFSSMDPILNNTASPAPIFNSPEIAENLNNGILQSTAGKSLKDLGLFASGFEGGLKITGATAFSASTFTTEKSTSNAVLTQSEAGSGFKVFTREGRQIAGLPLSDSDASKLLTSENGFNRNASYRADYLNEVGGTGYRGAEIKNLLPDGYFTIDTAASVLTNNAVSQLVQQSPALNQTPAQTVNFTTSDGLVDVNIALQKSMSMKSVAEKMNASLSQQGISVKATTIAAIELDPDAAANGSISFNINTHDGQKIGIGKNYTYNSLTTLVKPINDQTSRTGITAEISKDGKRLIMIHDEGQDISLDGFSGSLLNVNSLDQSYKKLLASDVGLNQATKIMGTLNIQSPREFVLKSTLGPTVTAQTDSMISGGVARSFTEAGTVADFSWDVTADQLASQASPDGLRIASPNTVFSLSAPVNGQSTPTLSVSLESRELTAFTSDSISNQLVQKARDMATLPSVQGSIIAKLPAENSTMTFKLGATEYTLKYKNAEFSITGKESQRILVASETVTGGHQLTISAPSGVMSGRSIEVLNDTDAKSFGLAKTDASSNSILRGRRFELTDGAATANVIPVSDGSLAVTETLTSAKKYMVTALGSTTFSTANSSDNVAQTVGTIFTSDGGSLSGTGTVTQVLTGNGGINGAGGDADFTSKMKVHDLSDLVTSDTGTEWIVADNTWNTNLTVGNKHRLTHVGAISKASSSSSSGSVGFVASGTKGSLQVTSVGQAGKVDITVGSIHVPATLSAAGVPAASAFAASSSGGATGFTGTATSNTITVTGAATAQGYVDVTVGGVVYPVQTASTSATTLSAQAAETASALNGLGAFSSLYKATHDGSTGLITITEAEAATKAAQATAIAAALNVDVSFKNEYVAHASGDTITIGNYFLNGQKLNPGISLIPAGQRFEVVENGSASHSVGTKFTLNLNSSGALVDESGTAIGSTLGIVESGGLTNGKNYMIASLGNTTFASANTADSVAESVGTIFTSDGSALTGTGTVTQVFTSNGGTNGAGGDAEFTSAMNVHALSDLVTGDAGSDWIVADSTSNTSLTVGNSHALTHDGTNYLLNGQVLSTGIKLIPAGQRFEVVDNGSSAHGEGTKFSLNMNSSGVIVDESGVALGSSLSVIRSGVSKVFDVKVGTNDAKVTVTNDRGIYSFTSNDANLKFVAPEPGLPSSFKASDHGGATGFAGKTSGNNIIVTSAATAQGNLGLTIAGVVYEVPTASSSASTVSAQAAETAAALNNLSSFSAIYTATHDGSTGLISITQAASVAKSVSSLKVDSSLKDPIVSLISAQTNGSLSITASLNAASLGITVAGFDFEIGSNGFQAISSEGKPTEVAVGVSGLSGQRLSIEKLPPEDLIVVLDKEGSRRLGMQYENADNLNGDPPEENYQVRMTDSVTGKIELFDTKTGDSIATRFSNGVTDFELKKYRIQLSGFADQGDIFNISLNQSNPGDARNMDALIALSRKSESRDSFQDDFRAIALGVGSQLVSGRMIEQSATAMRDAAAIAEDELSGVNLDEEAGRLLEQQQAYKAAAEILQAAKSMFDALLNIM